MYCLFTFHGQIALIPVVRGDNKLRKVGRSRGERGNAIRSTINKDSGKER